MDMTVTWLAILFALAIMAALFVAIPIGGLVLIASPEARAMCRRGFKLLAPVALALLVIGLFFGSTTVKVYQNEPATVVYEDEAKLMALLKANNEDSKPATISASPATGADHEPATDAVSITQFVGSSSAGQTVEQLPEWVHAPPVIDPAEQTELFTIRSSRYAGIEEAEADLLGHLRPRLAGYLRDGGYAIDASKITEQHLRQARIVKQRVVEQFDLEIGAHVEPVYQATWQVSLRPSIRDAIGRDYRLAVKQDRLWQVALAGGLLTLLFGTWAAYFRIDDNTGGRYRSRLRAAAIAASATGVAGLFLA